MTIRAHLNNIAGQHLNWAPAAERVPHSRLRTEERTVTAWFVPPIVVPIFLSILWLGYALNRAYM
jgi:hypothetical protein